MPKPASPSPFLQLLVGPIIKVSLVSGVIPRSLQAAIAIGLMECVGLIAFTVAIGISATRTGGWRADVGAVPVAIAEVITFGLFAVGIWLTVHFLRKLRPGARAPFVIIQLFGIFVARDVWITGGGLWPIIGWLVIALSVAGIVLVFLPTARAALDRRM